MYVLEQNAGLRGGWDSFVNGQSPLAFLFLVPPGFLVPILIRLYPDFIYLPPLSLCLDSSWPSLLSEYVSVRV